jgi:hypothetical protein
MMELLKAIQEMTETRVFFALMDGYHPSQGRCQSRNERQEMDSYHEKLMTVMRASKEKTEAMREVYLEKTRGLSGE